MLDYYAKSVDECPRKTHIIPLFRNDIYEMVKKEEFRDVLDESWYTQPQMPARTQNDAEIDRRGGFNPPMADEVTPITTLEQHVSVDLDGDGYAEPYIITIEEASQKVLRIVTRFDSLEDIEYNSHNEVISITPREYFTKYSFIPSPDGGIYDVGFGMLLGPLNESVNSIINQLVDSGTMATTGGGFLGRGAKIRGGDYTFAPNEWKRIDSTVDDLRKAIFPRPTVEPSNVLFQTLGLLIEYTNRISSSTDVMVGQNPGQNTPAETSRNMVEQGMKIYSAIFKRIWRSMKSEFKKWYILNALYLPLGERQDYLDNPDLVVPSADPHVTSESQSLQRAMTIKQLAMTTPGYAIPEVELDILRALHVEDIPRIYPGPDKVPPLPNPKMQVEQLKLEAKKMEIEFRRQSFGLELMEQHKLNVAKIYELEAMAIKLSAEADGIAAGHKIAAFNAAIGALKVHNDGLKTQIDAMMKGAELEQKQQDSRAAGMGGMAQPPHGGSVPQLPQGQEGTP